MSIAATSYLEKWGRRKRGSLLSLGSLKSCWAEKVSIFTFITMLATDVITTPGSALNTLDALIHLSPAMTRGKRYYFYTHSTDATTEAHQKVSNLVKVSTKQHWH